MVDGTSRRGKVLWPVELHAEVKSCGRLELHVEVERLHVEVKRCDQLDFT